MKVKIHFNDTGENDAVVDYLVFQTSNTNLQIEFSQLLQEITPFQFYQEGYM